MIPSLMIGGQYAKEGERVRLKRMQGTAREATQQEGETATHGPYKAVERA